MLLKEIIPSPVVSNFVRLYRIIDFEFPISGPIPPKAYTPRPEQCLQFFITPTAIQYPGTGEVVIPLNALLVGQHTITNNRTVYSKFLSLQVVFQPGALYRLLAIPQTLFSNQAVQAGEVMGNEIALVNEQLFHAKDYQSMIDIVETFIIRKINKVQKERHHLDRMTQQMLLPDQGNSLDWYVRNTYLGHRQFDRKFTERMGIGPKEFMRVCRFDTAYRMKNRYPEKDWLTIAIHCGYHDYQHLARDYKEFTGHTPARFFALDSPERILGSEEVY